MKQRRKLGILARMKKLRPGLYFLVAAGLVVLVCGCTRKFYRKAADKEVEGILAEKDVNPCWKIEQWHVYPDPRSRYADGSDPDHPPMPPDDKAAFALSPHPQAPGKPGVGTITGTAWLELVNAWDTANRAERRQIEQKEKGEADGPTTTDEGPSLLPVPKEIQTTGATQDDMPKDVTPAPAANSEIDPRRPIQGHFDEFLRAKPPGFLINLDQAVELGVLNSPTYQTFREQLYEAALPVALNRYNFAYQFALTEDWIRQSAAPGSSVGERNNWTGITNVSFTKMFSTGAMLMFDFVNRNVFNFAAPKGFTSTSRIDLDITQPLLQGGGKAVALEPLTLSERGLLYSIRAYARFREQFYANIAQGNSLPGSLPAAVGGGGATGPISTLAALGIASTDVAGGFVSYLSTLYRECDLAADLKLVQDLQRALRIYEGYQEGGQYSPLQVDQVRSQLLQAQNTVLGDRQFMNNALDQFKLSLGMPANMPLILDDAPARPITRQFDRYYEVIYDSDLVYKQVEAQEMLAPEKLRGFLMDIYTNTPLVRGTEFQKKVPAWWLALTKTTDAALTARLNKLRDDRRRLLDRKTELELKGGALTEEEARVLRDDEIESDVAALEQVLRRYEAKPWQKLAKAEARQQDRIKLFRLVAYSAEIVLVWARNERFDNVSTQWPERAKAMLCDLDLSTVESQRAQEEAVKYSLAHRFDLMNARAQVVDSWRQLRVTANALLGVFNVEYHLDSITPPNGTKPFAFSTYRTNQTLTLDTRLPLNRLAQRNAYRIALINYQEARRALITLEDNIAVQVRFDVRQLQLFAENYRIQKRLIQSLYAQVESALELITAPADPSALQATGTSGAANAAALTNQYLQALGSLNGAQTRMYDIWLSYVATRIQLYLDMESLRTDERGVWVEGPIATEEDCSCPAGPPRPIENSEIVLIVPPRVQAQPPQPSPKPPEK